MVRNITRIQNYLHFLSIQILIYYWLSEASELCHNFEESSS
jgi:hypothetical protein